MKLTFFEAKNIPFWLFLIQSAFSVGKSDSLTQALLGFAYKLSISSAFVAFCLKFNPLWNHLILQKNFRRARIDCKEWA
jgi:hypothetical protein